MNKLALIILVLTGFSFPTFAQIKETPDKNAKQDTTDIKSTVTDEDRIPTVTLSGDDDEAELAGQNVSGVLSASRDPFINAAAFNLSSGGFEIRGYDAEALVYLNGTFVNNFETGQVFFGAWGGLNDVTRSRESTTDLMPSPYAFGGLGGATAIDTRASEQRKQVRLSYLFSNRAYAGRAMATWSTGMMKNGWAVSLSGSKRWAEEGYVPGTFYNAYSYFGSVDKKLNDRHLLNLTILGTPSKRGGASPSVQTANDLAGTNFYNPQWGWQDGKKRNARITNSHQPMAILRHDWQISEKATLTTAASHWFGRYGRTQLDWFNAPDPRPDYYRKLPEYFQLNYGEQTAQEISDIYKNDPDLLQIQWNDLYDANRLNGQSWEGEPGLFSQYVISESRSDLKRWNWNTYYQNIVSEHLTLNFGLNYLRERTHYFSVLQDLLGGDYFVNIDRFALDTPLPGQTPTYNVDNSDVIVREGDTYEYDYYLTGQRYGSWLQGMFSFKKLDFFLAGELSRMDFYRTGNFRNGRFPNESLGDSKKQDFLNYSGKGGVTYKINGRNYLYANGLIASRAPDLRVAYASPRSRDQLVPGLTKETVYSGEAGYLLRSPRLKGRATFFWTQINDGLKLNRFYLADDVTQFGSYILTGLDRRHAGIEVAGEFKVSPSWEISGVAAVGEYIYTSRPNGYFVIDDDGRIEDRGEIYVKNFYVPNTPQTALSGSLEYRSPNFWSASVTVNYFDRNYIDFSAERRRPDLVFGLEEGSDFYKSIVNQTRIDDVVTVDLFANKSYKINDHTFFNLTLGVNNLLNNTLITGGFEQLRFNRAEVERDGVNVFPPKYFYGFGTNFFVMGAVRI